jgi:hypothetical protein
VFAFWAVGCVLSTTPAIVTATQNTFSHNKYMKIKTNAMGVTPTINFGTASATVFKIYNPEDLEIG